MYVYIVRNLKQWQTDIGTHIIHIGRIFFIIIISSERVYVKIGNSKVLKKIQANQNLLNFCTWISVTPIHIYFQCTFHENQFDEPTHKDIYNKI